MSVVSTWLAFMGYGIVIFLVGLLWARKERRDHTKSSSQPGQGEAGNQPYRTSLGSHEQSSSQLREH